MDQLLTLAALAFDLVILDTAPVLALADTRILAMKADVVVLLARWRKTPARAIGASVRLLQQSNAQIAGVALTQVDMNAQSKHGYGDSVDTTTTNTRSTTRPDGSAETHGKPAIDPVGGGFFIAQRLGTLWV
jgi:Mrp family chromosome partitioning ATPase